MTAALPVHGADLHRSLPGATHQVLNQVKDLVDIDAFDGDAVASFALGEHQAGWAAERARKLAASVWSGDTQYAAGYRTATPRSCAPWTAPGTASTRSSSIPPTTS